MEFHDNYPNYEVMSNHGEEEGKKGRKTLWNVFWVMLFITIFELVIGFLAPGQGWSGTWWLKTLFIGLTIVKAAAIVLWFMHLGHEVKFFKYIILMPYLIFMLYTIFIVLTEGTYAGGAACRQQPTTGGECHPERGLAVAFEVLRFAGSGVKDGDGRARSCNPEPIVGEGDLEM